MAEDTKPPIPPPPTPAGSTPPSGGTPPPMFDPFGEMDAKGYAQKRQQILSATVPAHTLKFDEKHFLELLAGSISLTFDEKMQIIQTIPKLTQAQIDELIKILEEEKQKFAELNERHLSRLKELEEKHEKEWQALEKKAEETLKEDEDKKMAEDILKGIQDLDKTA